ncbi:protein of unknown function [Cupriavidus taiwanensis]|uniref:Uncharacterized protein n=1 Tax=Cupriavidus taiwanensis TaxID=164546 RepID=A0A375IBX0_9BURK|nr:protein of unknown function [Cupriavidus taiwanensis]
MRSCLGCLRGLLIAGLVLIKSTLLPNYQPLFGTQRLSFSSWPTRVRSKSPRSTVLSRGRFMSLPSASHALSTLQRRRLIFIDCW